MKTINRINKHTVTKIAVILAVLTILSGCETLSSDESAIKYRRLHRFLNGGISEDIIKPGKKEVLWPWDTVYKFKTGVREVGWGPGAKNPKFLKTRSRDGNELDLEVVVRYEVVTSSDTLPKLARFVSPDDEGIDEVVFAIAESDIRTYLNELNTKEFTKSKYVESAEEKIQQSMNNRLRSYGINITLVKLKDFHFQKDYQNILDQIQQAREDTTREELRIETVRAKKSQEINIAQGEANRLIKQAEGNLAQAKVRGEEFLKRRNHDAEVIKARGDAEIDGLTEKLKALQGPGGEAILKIEIIKALIAAKSKFVVMDQGESQSMNVNKVDTNNLLGQLGLIEGYVDNLKQSDRNKPIVEKKDEINELQLP